MEKTPQEYANDLMDEGEFIGNYLEKEMKNHGLTYGLEYYNLLDEKTEKAERAYKRYVKKQKTILTNL